MDTGDTGRGDPKAAISEHAVDVLERILAEAGRYGEMPDRNFFLMSVANTLFKAIFHLSAEVVGTRKAATYAKMQIEALGPLLSSGGQTFEVRVTAR